jgi:hypothetical protein
MILFPLMTTWMWFQIFTASPLPYSGRLVEAYMVRSNDKCNIKGVKHG